MMIDSKTMEAWKPGHPSFSPFKLKEKVVLKVNKLGNALKFKLGQKFTGPYEVVKVRENKVTYEVKSCSNNEIIKAHHTQLRLFKDPPPYLQKHMLECMELEETGEPESRNNNEVGNCHEWLDNNFNSSVSSSSESSCNTSSSNNIGSADKGGATVSESSSITEQSAGHISIPDRDHAKTNTKDILLSKAGDIVDLNKLPCSEFIPNQDVMHSTPGNGVNCGMPDYVKEANEINSSLEKSITMFNELQNNMHDVIFNLATILDNNTISEVSVGPLMGKQKAPNKSCDSWRDLRQMFEESSERADFSGFAQLFKGFEVNDHHKEVIKDLKDIVSTAKADILESRRRSNKFKFDIQNYRNNRDRGSFFTTFGNSDTSNRFSLETPQRCLRSQGPAVPFPNVQKGILEYRRKKID